MKIAIVHDWLVTLGGSELVLRELLRVFPNADVFTLIDKMPAADRDFLGVQSTSTSFLDRLPGSATHHRAFLPLFRAAVRSLNVRGYDVVISNSHAAAKGVRTTERQLHICYCLSPMRYAWDLRDQYLLESGWDRGPRGVIARALLRSLQRWDRKTSGGVDVFVTLSNYIADRIRRAYDREAAVIYPPVDVDFYSPDSTERGEYYVTASRFVPYKRIDLIARAFSELGDRRLIIAGAGPDEKKIRAAAGPNVLFAGRVTRERLRDLLRAARAFIFAADEDFGIAPVEAQACGTPVIAYGRGGALETIRADSDAPTGVLFHAQTVDALTSAIREFETLPRAISPIDCRANAERFSEQRFRTEIAALVDREWRAWTTRELSAPS